MSTDERLNRVRLLSDFRNAETIGLAAGHRHTPTLIYSQLPGKRDVMQHPEQPGPRPHRLTDTMTMMTHGLVAPTRHNSDGSVSAF